MQPVTALDGREWGRNEAVEMPDMGELEDPVARAQLKGHIDVCTERYGNLWTTVNRIEMQMNGLSNRVFAIVLGSCGTAILGLAALIFWEITKKGG